MYAGTILGAALALCGTTMAVPAAAAANGLRPRDGDNDNDLQNAPWVTVDDEGAPRTTFTPTVTTISGTPSAVNAAPHDLTATVYTMTNYGHVYTTTQAPPNPTATNAKTNEGAFSRCYNKEGPYAPFCRPSHNSSIYIDNTYYGKVLPASLHLQPSHATRLLNSTCSTPMCSHLGSRLVQQDVQQDALRLSPHQLLQRYDGRKIRSRHPAAMATCPIRLPPIQG